MKIPQERFFVLATYDLLLQNLDLIAEAHLNCSVYLSAHKVLDAYKKDDIIKIKNFFDKNGLSIITHGPFLDLNPGSLDEKIRKVCLERFIESIELSKLLGAEYITLHDGYRPVPYIKYKDEWLKRSIDLWKQVLELAAKENIKINIENALDKDPKIMVELVGALNSPNFKLCFDPGHFNAFSDISPLDAFDMLPPHRIGEIHISDNDGTDDQHLPLGQGNIDLDTLFEKIEKLKIEPICTLEPRDIPGLKKDLKYLKSKGIID